jgi:[protein-PII] uridylyltransferase
MLKSPPISPEIVKSAPIELFEHKDPSTDIVGMGDYKKFWAQQQKMLRTYHVASQSGNGLVQMHARMMDELLRYFYKNAKNGYSKKYEKEWSQLISLVAIGGYGRSELSPHSDVDLMLLYSEKIGSDLLTTFLDVFNEEIIYPLWDLKIAVKHAYRTVNHSITDAKRDFKVKNAQLDGRLICGSKELFEVFREKYENFFRNEPVEAFVSQCIEEREHRHRKYDFTVFLQEPDIKTGVGGLYDYQTILWLGRAKLRASTIEAIEHQGILIRGESIQLEKAYNFLLRTRNELHFQNDGASNLLNIEKQSQVALGIGYNQKEEFNRTKMFMRDYFEQTQVIREISENFEERLSRRVDREKKRSWFKKIFKINFKTVKSPYPKKYIDGFVIANNCLTYESRNVFIEDPIRLIRLFRHAQQYHVELSHEIKKLIKKSVYLIDKEVINHPSANRCFSSILQSLGEVYPILTLMHELGVLGHFLPEFRDIMYLIQHEHYQQYTVDIHTLNTIQVLDEIFRYKNTKGKRYYESIKNTTRPWLLYLLLLLHDLGKVNGGTDHSEMGATIAKPILDRLKIGHTQQEYILFVIKNNQRMVRFWQRFDMDDPQVPAAFALFVGGTELLNYFYVQTYCDLRATAAGLWNSHKEMLHTKLFEKTLEFLIKHEGYIEQRIEHKKDLYKESICKYNPNITQIEAEKMLLLYPDQYFMLNSPEEFDLHIRLFDEANRHIEKSSCSGSLMPVIHWEYDIDQCLTIVTIVTWKRSGFFASLSGAFALSGFNILEAKAFSRTDQMSIKVFHIMESSNDNATSEYLEEKFYHNLRQILVNNMDPSSSIAIQIKKRHKNTRLTRQGLRPIPRTTPRLNVNHEPSSKKTVLEIQCTDQLGLVYQFANTIAQQGFNIIFSRISIEYGEVVTIFQINKNNSDETTTAKDLIALRESINKIIEIKK